MTFLSSPLTPAFTSSSKPSNTSASMTNTLIVNTLKKAPKNAYATLLGISIAAGMGLTSPANAEVANRPTSINPATKIAIGEATSTQAIAKQSDSVLQQPSSTKQAHADGIIALVNDNAILKSDLEAAIAQTQRRAQALGEPLPNAQRLQDDVLNALILRELQLSLVNRIGIKPSDDTVNQRLAQIAQGEGLNSLPELQQTLDAQQRGSYAALRNQIIEDAAIQILQQRQIASRVRITDQDVEAFLASPEAARLNQNEYQTIHVRVPYIDDYSRLSEQQRNEALAVANNLYDVLTQKNIDVAAAMSQVQAGYALPLQGGDMGYHKASALPAQLAGVITSLKAGEVSKPIVTPEGIDVVKLANIRSSNTMIIPQWHTRHILIKVDELQSDALAQQKINDLYEQLRQGANFADLASTYSDDLGSAGRGGDLDWVEEGAMVAPFEEVMKKTPVGDFSTPFRTQFGWHILKVDDIRQQDVSEQYRRKLAQEALYQRMAPQAKEDWLQELKAGAYIKIL